MTTQPHLRARLPKRVPDPISFSPMHHRAGSGLNSRRGDALLDHTRDRSDGSAAGPVRDEGCGVDAIANSSTSHCGTNPPGLGERSQSRSLRIGQASLIGCAPPLMDHGGALSASERGSALVLALFTALGIATAWGVMGRLV